jgi:3-oxoacyl-[acyl-carrier-protein] synthase-3
MQITLPNIHIAGVSSALPENQIEIESIKEKFGSLEVQRIIASTGIQSVRVAKPHQNTSHLCAAAANILLKELSILPNDIDGIVLVTQTPDVRMPATSVLLQHKLGLPTTAVAFDINYGCSGYLYGLFQAALLVSTGACERVIVCVGDTISKFLDPNDHTVRLVFGDAGSATLIEKGSQEISFNIGTDGSGANSLHIGLAKYKRNASYLHMDGQAIPKAFHF